MLEVAPAKQIDTLREILKEFRTVGQGLQNVLERTVRLETKVDSIVKTQELMATVDSRLTSLETQAKAEHERQYTRLQMRVTWWIVCATLAGGTAGTILAHYWK